VRGSTDAVTVVSRNDVPAAHLAFTETFTGLRQSGSCVRSISTPSGGKRLAFTLDGLHRDPTDLADRIDEIATGLPNAQRKPHGKPDMHADGTSALDRGIGRDGAPSNVRDAP
jgi:hypothetical protein